MGYKFDSANHVHTLNNWPLIGVSSVGNVLAKPLTWWASGLALKGLGWTKIKEGTKYVPKEQRLSAASNALDLLQGMDPKDYLTLLDECYRAHDRVKTESAEAGTDRHAIIEKFVKKEMGEFLELSDEEVEAIGAYIIWSKDNVKKYLWSEVNCYSEKHWVGGISDIGCELNNGKVAIIDIKSSKEAYPSQFFQCAGYDICISENGGYTSEGQKVFDLEGRQIEAHIIFPFGAKEPTGIINYDVADNRRAFLAELFLLKQLQKFEK